MATPLPTFKSGTDRFNTEAADWDSNPSLHRASALALTSITHHIPEVKSHGAAGDATSGLDVLEIGCGTGLLSFLIAPLIRSLTAVDVAEGMISALKLKLQARPEVQNVLPVWALLEDPDDGRISADPVSGRADADGARRRFDLVISHLVLHHIPSLEDVMQTMFGCLKSGGRVALTDFENFGPQARRFHAEARMEGVERHGIARSEMEKLLKDAGFVDVKIETAFEMEKKVEKIPGKGLEEDNAEMMVFPFLICLGRKP